jgi:hypothetical protein
MIPELGMVIIGLSVLALLGYVLACTMNGQYEPTAEEHI